MTFPHDVRISEEKLKELSKLMDWQLKAAGYDPASVTTAKLRLDENVTQTRDSLEQNPQTIPDPKDRAILIFTQWHVDEVTGDSVAADYAKRLVERLAQHGLAITLAKPQRNTYAFEFSDSDWEEINSLYEVGHNVQLSRPEWMAIADMAVGKACRLDAGDYDMDAEDAADSKAWADQLRTIAGTINAFFRPGDGKI